MGSWLVSRLQQRQTRQSQCSSKALYCYSLGDMIIYPFDSSKRLGLGRPPAWNIPRDIVSPIYDRHLSFLPGLLVDWIWIYPSVCRHPPILFRVGPMAVQWNRAQSGKLSNGRCQEGHPCMRPNLICRALWFLHLTTVSCCSSFANFSWKEAVPAIRR